MYRLAAALLLACVGAGAVLAAEGYRWRDGRLERADDTATPPRASPVDARTPATASDAPGGARPTPAPVAGLRFETRGDRTEAWVDNHLAGPIEVLLRPLDGAIPGAEPTLPARAVVPALDRRVVARLPATVAARFHLDVMRGSPNARAIDVEYGYPLGTDALQIEQGWGGGYSHTDPENRYGVDFAADIGTPVLAARAGTVMETEGAYARAGQDAGHDLAQANFIRILHEDGTMALYAHLQTDGVLVRPGQRVRRGEIIGRSGNTGFTTGPHLHFAVQVNRGMRLESIPFRMFGPQGILRFSELR